MVKLFADDKMYCSIRSTCMRVMNDAKVIKLHPVELFYLSLCVIDRMKGLTANEAVAYVLDEAWYEGQEYFIKVYGEDSDVERNAALGLVLQTCAEWLLRSHDTSKIQIVTALKNLMVHKIGGDFSEKMDGEFRRGFRSIDENQFALIVNDYLQSDRLLSEEIDKVLDFMESNSVVEHHPSGVTCPIRIAKGKKTSVLMIFNSMYKAGWLTDVNGNTLKNRDEALNQILRNGFGVEKETAISQTLNPSNCTTSYSDRFESLMRKLFDGQDMDPKVRDLIQELLDTEK